jgi:hypothetical protein
MRSLQLPQISGKQVAIEGERQSEPVGIAHRRRRPGLAGLTGIMSGRHGRDIPIDRRSPLFARPQAIGERRSARKCDR